MEKHEWRKLGLTNDKQLAKGHRALKWPYLWVLFYNSIMAVFVIVKKHIQFGTNGLISALHHVILGKPHYSIGIQIIQL